MTKSTNSSSSLVQMNIPQELIDKIIEEIHPYDWRSPFILYDTRRNVKSARSLRALIKCTQVSRAFVRQAQTRIFAAVALGNGHENIRTNPSYRAFSRLLQQRPHLSSYVRHLRIAYTLSDAAPLAEILSRLSNVEEGSFFQSHQRGFPDKYSQWDAHSAPLKAAFIAALSCPTLCRVTMQNYGFVDAWELHDLLRNSTGLNHLSFQNIQFGTHRPTNPPTEANTLRTPNILVKSLELIGLTPAQETVMMSAFTAVDITHLRSLALTNPDTALMALLRANVTTLQAFKIGSPYGREPVLGWSCRSPRDIKC